MEGVIIFLVVGALVAAVVWWNWAMAPLCPGCGAPRSKRWRHQRNDGGPDRRYANNAFVCTRCGHEGDYVSRSTYRTLLENRQRTPARTSPRVSVSAPATSVLDDAETHEGARSTRHGGAAAVRRWVGSSEAVDIGGRRIAGGLLYVVDGSKDERPYCPATVIAGLAVGGGRNARDLGYWPSYYYLTPAQRGAYLDWLATGRSHPDIDLGYVFLFFYGLEWRALVDGQDRSEIAREVLRLYGIYGRHRSFHDYALNLLGVLLLAGGKANKLDPILAACAGHAADHGGLPPLLLDGVIWQHAGKGLPFTWAEEIAQSSQAFRKGVAHERHRERFRALFAQRFAERYPSGIIIPQIAAPAEVPYRWALRGSPREDLTIRSTGLLIGPSGKRKDLAMGTFWEGLQEIWQQATREVMAENRGRRVAQPSISTRSADPVVVIYAPEPGAQPAGLGAEPIPPFADPAEAWYEERADDAGVVTTTLGELYALRGGPAPAMLTPTQQTRLIESLEAIGLAVEPDLRPDCRRAPQEESRSVVRLDLVKRPSALCQQLRPLVEASIAIASSDGAVDDAEMEEIIAHLDQKDRLHESERRRLRLYASWLVRTRQIDLGFNRLRRAELPKTHRKAIAALGIAVALRDGRVTDAERTAIGRLYRALQLPEEDLDALLKPPAQAKSGITIDWNAVARLQAETEEVQGMLAQVLAQDEASAPAATTAATGAPADAPAASAAAAERPASAAAASSPAPDAGGAYPGLDPRAATVLAGLAGRGEISTTDFKALCAGTGLMPSAAIDLINEWSDANLGDRCIDGDGPYQIATHLLAART